MRILVVEDEQAIADFIQRGLTAEGYVVSCAYDGLRGEQLALQDDPDLVILDVMLPGKSGFELLKQIRKQRAELPIIMLTALGETEQKVEGLDKGATDYVTKPFSFAELAARVRAHLRKPSQTDSTTLRVGDIGLDFRTRQVTAGQDQVNLSAREFDLLAYFMRHPGQVLSREQLLSGVWGYDHDPGTNVVEVYVGYLRRKLGQRDHGTVLMTVRSVGYRLVEDSG